MMIFSEREEVIEFLNRIETDFATETWQYKKVKVWPILKTYFFLKMFWGAQNKSSQINKESRFVKSFKAFIKRKLIGFKIQKLKLTSVDFLFFSGVNFRENFEGKSLHKFYDPIGDFLDEFQKKFTFFEYGFSVQNSTYKNRGFNLQFLYPYFEGKVVREKVSFHQWEGFEKFKDFVENRLGDSEFSVKPEVEDALKKVFVWESCFDWVLKNTNPKKVFLLSYYNLPCFGLLMAAKKKGIESIDIQHGTQGVLHPAYSGFKDDYGLIPDVFWLWDHETESQLKKNFDYSEFETLVGGNPWHSFLNQKEKTLEKNRPSILYTLQPIYPLMDEYVLKAIQATINEFDWLIRLHPRIGSIQIKELKEQLISLGIYNAQLWQLANESPLPLLLKNVDLHISKFSGCISEAADLGTFSIILEKNGEITYKHLIEQGIAMGGIDSEYQHLVNAIHLNIGKKKLVERIGFEAVLNELYHS